MTVANFRGVMSADNSPAVSRQTKGKGEGFSFTLSQRDQGDVEYEVVRINCFALQDGSLLTRVHVQGHEYVEYITER